MSKHEEPVQLATADQREAMRHPTRHRITLALREPMTVSGVARELGINKGNASHHVAVLERVGLITRVGTRTGRGGTGVLFRSAPLALSGREAAQGMMRAVEEGVVADPSALAFLRTVRLTNSQAELVSRRLEEFVAELPSAPGATRRGVFVALFNA